MTSKWLLLTAGFGDSNMEGAALRVKAQAESLDLLDKVVAVTNSDLPNSCPEVFSKYAQYLNPSHKGFGYFSWKVELVYGALHGRFGDFDGVVWVDAGCEIFNSPWTRKRMKRWLKSSEESGHFLYTLGTPEQDYTKSLTFSEFPHLSSEDRSPQIQATWFMLHGETGRKISEKWLEVAMKDISLLDLSPSPGGEVDTFVEHRFDQSLLSLTCKSLGIRISGYLPCSGNSGVKSQLRGVFHPVWTARNRSAKSIFKI
jgi:hypothetical protein